MAYKPDVKRNYKSGLQLNREPFIIEEDAFQSLFNAYVWRGRIKKKLGTYFVGRLAREFVNTAAGNSGASPWSFNIFTVTSIGAADTNKDVAVGTVVITIQAGPNIVFTDQGDGTLTSPTPGNSGTINYATGAIVLTHTAGAGVATVISFRYYPSRPVMGLPSKTLIAINEEELIAFDTRYAYLYSNATNRFIETPSTLVTTWSGTNSQIFWTENAYRALFATNDVAGLHGYAITNITQAVSAVIDIAGHTLVVNDYVQIINVSGMIEINGLVGQITAIVPGVSITVDIDSTAFTPYVSGGVAITSIRNIAGDGIRWYDDTSWTNFNPAVNGVTALKGCGIIVFYRGRIVCLDTKEGNTIDTAATRYPQRARWSQNGTPFVMPPVPQGSNIGTEEEAWREDIPGRGGYNDCPTTEEIVGACFLRDTLIVGFERSIWKLRYTNNELIPFVWERLNVELGVDGRFSGIKFDDRVLFIGTRGATECDGVGVRRIDFLIPDIVFNFSNVNSGPERIVGIRDFQEQIAYWTFPNDNTANGVFPNQVMLYNYMEQCWAILKDSFTTYGYWQPFYDLRWIDLQIPWQQMIQTWQSPFGNTEGQRVVAGNQIGYVHQVQAKVANDPSLKVNAMTVVANQPTVLTIVSHNLDTSDYVLLSGFLGLNTSINGQICIVRRLTADTIELYEWDPSTGVTVEYTGGFGGADYIGGGQLTRIDNFRVLTKKFNPYLDNAVSVRMNQIDFYVTATASGRFVVNLYVGDQNAIVANPVTPDNPISNRVETFANPYEAQGQEKYWHSLYDTVTGNLFQVELTYENEEMNDPEIFQSKVTIHSIAPQSSVASTRLT